jgi:hypothetical protein
MQVAESGLQRRCSLSNGQDLSQHGLCACKLLTASFANVNKQPTQINGDEIMQKPANLSDTDRQLQPTQSSSTYPASQHEHVR